MRRLVAALALAGCTSTSPSPTDSTPTQEPNAKVEPADDVEQAPPNDDVKQAPPSEPPPGVDPVRWKCDEDKDCTQTCALGAVNAEWIAANPNEDTCDDGCGWKHGMEACRDGECVTLDRDGNVDAGCTKLTRPAY